MEKVQSVVPARSGSKSIRNKNLSIIGGVPLIVRSLIHAMKTLPKVRPILSSDSEEYAEIAASYLSDASRTRSLAHQQPGSLVNYGEFDFHLRTDNTATDYASIPSVLLEIEKSLPEAHTLDAWLVLQPTSPFRSGSDFANWGLLCSQVGPDASVVSFKKVDDAHPARMYRFDGERMSTLGIFEGYQQTPRQSLPEVYLRDGGFYLIGRELVSAGLQFNDSPEGIIREFPWNLNIDGSEDLILASHLAATDSSLRI